jgi:hypothetical protein
MRDRLGKAVRAVSAAIVLYLLPAAIGEALVDVDVANAAVAGCQTCPDGGCLCIDSSGEHIGKECTSPASCDSCCFQLTEICNAGEDPLNNHREDDCSCHDCR